MKYLIIIGALALLPLVPARAEPMLAVVISEVGWAGSSLSTADEYVELANLMDGPIDLSGYRLTGGGEILLPAGAAIPARGTYLVANFAADDARSALARTPDLITTAVALSNSALSLALAAPDGTVLDRAGDGSTPLAGRTSSSGSGARSMTRALPLSDGTLASSWLAAESADGLDAGLPDLGTPGTNDLAAAAVETVTETPLTLEVVVEEPEAVDPAVGGTPEDSGTMPEPSPDELASPEQPTGLPEPTTGVVASDTDIPVEALVQAEPLPAETPEEPTLSEVAPSGVEGPVPIVFPPRTLLINELYPIPATGEDEFVEILNPYNNVIPLNGWALKDGSGAKTPLPDQPLGLGQMVVLRNPKGRLNNDGDALSLLAPDGSVNDAVAYGKDGQKAGRAFIRVEDHLELTLRPTPGEPNALEPLVTPSPAPPPTSMPPQASPTPNASPYALPTPPPEPDRPGDQGIRPPPVVAAIARSVAAAKPLPVASVPAATGAAKPVPRKASVRAAAAASRVTIASLRDLALNKRVLFQAVVSAAPGAIGKQLMAVEDRTGGTVIFQNEGHFPELAVGDRVEVVGLVSTSRGMRRVRLDAKSSVRALAHGEAPEPRETDDPSEEDVGALIRVTGLLTKAGIETATGAVAIRLPAQTLAKPGDRVEAAGILVSADGAPKLLPRSAGDLRVLSTPQAPAAAMTKDDGKSRSGVALAALTIAAVAAFALRPHVQSLITRYAKRPALAVPAQAAD